MLLLVFKVYLYVTDLWHYNMVVVSIEELELGSCYVKRSTFSVLTECLIKGSIYIINTKPVDGPPEHHEYHEMAYLGHVFFSSEKKFMKDSPNCLESIMFILFVEGK